MPKKVPFSVVYVTGEEEKYKSSELDHHGPSVRGWQSCRDCTYPQELILHLHVMATLQQIQILAHQYLIPERIDLWIGPERDDNETEPINLPYDYLGYITLSDNMNTDYKSRELKSITVPPFRATSYIKLRLHKNHKNVHNTFNQVSIVAIQLLGDEVELHGTLVESITGLSNESLDKSSYVSVCDDLAFEMYVDRDVARIIRLLEERKHQAVQDERFEYARKLKAAMAELRLAGERLGKLEIGKKQAIQNEDYIRAKRKKAQMEEYRKDVYTMLRVHELLEENGVPKTVDEWNEIEKKFLQRWNFPKCCGAIDGKHVDNKKSYSIILFAMVDADYCFTYVNIGGNGRASDSAIFRDSILNIAMESKTLGMPENAVIIGDYAFPLKPNLMKPYSKIRLSDAEKIFNYRLSRARRVAENAFGILVWRFRVFSRPIELKPDTIDKVIWAACSLHNWLRKTAPGYYLPQQAVDREDLNNGNVTPGIWREDTNVLQPVTHLGSNNYSHIADEIRREYVKYFTEQNTLPGNGR